MLSLPIETVIFDMDGTLRQNVPSADDTIYNFSLQLGLQPAPGLQIQGARWAHFYWAQSSDLFVDIERFGETNDQFWENYSYRYLRALNIPDG